MTETADPRAALAAADVPTKAAGARDLAAVGTWDDLDPLLDLATDAKSLGLRLTCAAAAADIVARRCASGPPVPDVEIQRIVARVQRIDPERNPSAPMVLSGLASPAALDRLGRLLRDPRNTVRRAATLAIRRMALSHAGDGRDAVQGALPAWMATPRLAPDALADLARLIGEAGFHDLGGVLAGLPASPAVDAAVSDARATLAAWRHPDAFDGVWCADGRDVLGGAPAEPEPHTLLIADGAASFDLGPARPVARVDGALHVQAGSEDAAAIVLRGIRAPRVGEAEATSALQTRGRTWFRATPDDLLAWFQRHALAAAEPAHPATRALVLAVEAAGPAAHKLVAPALLVAGDLDAAAALLLDEDPARRPRADDALWVARLHDLRGDASAIPAYRDYLARSGVKPWARQAVQARLELLETT
jgi:hypothetical protein